jgi:hypothetical protein
MLSESETKNLAELKRDLEERISRVEKELNFLKLSLRLVDEARVAYSIISAKVKRLGEALGPSLSVEKMIHTYLVSGNVDPNVLMALMDKWLVLNFEAVKAGGVER